MKRIAAFLLCLTLAGCGYSSQTLLPEHIRRVHVPAVDNRIDITGEVTHRRSFEVYRPGLEVELRNSVIERIVFDGHLKIAEKQNADAELRLHLREFRRDPLRYNLDESIQEFRIVVVAAVEFIDLTNQEILWEAQEISGNAPYFLSGPLAGGEDQAVNEALEDLARHLVEEIIEIW